MKKTFSLTGSKVKPERHIESLKKEINKYLKRERRKELPEKVDFWDFDCRIGENEVSAKEIHVNDISKNIDEAAKADWGQFYLEILVKKGIRKKKSE